MRSGDFRERVTLQRPVLAQDASGEAVETWGDLAADLPAQVEALRGAEKWAAAQLHGETLTRFTVRYLPGVAGDTTLRLLWGGRVFDLQSAEDPDGRRRRLELVGLEVR